MSPFFLYLAPVSQEFYERVFVFCIYTQVICIHKDFSQIIFTAQGKKNPEPKYIIPHLTEFLFVFSVSMLAT